MPSSIAWLDVSAEEQRRAREMLALFTQTESRDELGIGPIRDALSDSLWPGTSVLQTRARYYLFVPWLFKLGARHRRGPALYQWVQKQERVLIETLRASGADEGLIGSRAGPSLKVLPSTIYWHGMTRYGIVAPGLSPSELGEDKTAPVEHEESSERPITDWYPTLPEPIAGFPGNVGDGFTMTAEEAAWLSERMRTAAPGTLLEHLLDADREPDRDSQRPWDDSVALEAPPEPSTTLMHAKRFALSMWGAAMLYNLQVAELYEAAGCDRVADPVASYRELINDWLEHELDVADLQRWDRADFWERILRVNPRISPATRIFVDAWLDALLSGPKHMASDESLRRLIATRERRKGSQSRFTNEKLLETWSGEAGMGLLIYRWDRVRRIVTDIHEGIANAGA